MNIESQVTSLELSKKLKELGFKNRSLFGWFFYSNDWHVLKCGMKVENGFAVGYQFIEFDKDVIVNDDDLNETCSAYTTQELLEMLPHQIIYRDWYYTLLIQKNAVVNKNSIGYACYYHKDIQHENGNIFYMTDIKLCDALAKMLIYLVENKFMDLKYVHRR